MPPLKDILGLISLNFTDNDYYAAIFSRDNARQYRAVQIEASVETIELAREWINKQMGVDLIISYEDKSKYFDLFSNKVKNKKIHPYYKVLNENIAFKAAKDVIKEISYHYKDIDGNFIQQFQSFNGFDARLWELYLFCMCREEMFSFKRNSYAPDFIIEKLDSLYSLLDDSYAIEKIALKNLKTKYYIDFYKVAVTGNKVDPDCPGPSMAILMLDVYFKNFKDTIIVYAQRYKDKDLEKNYTKAKKEI